MASFSKRFSQEGACLKVRGNSQPRVQARTHSQSSFTSKIIGRIAIPSQNANMKAITSWTRSRNVFTGREIN